MEASQNQGKEIIRPIYNTSTEKQEALLRHCQSNYISTINILLEEFGKVEAPQLAPHPEVGRLLDESIRYLELASMFTTKLITCGTAVDQEQPDTNEKGV